MNKKQAALIAVVLVVQFVAVGYGGMPWVEGLVYSLISIWAGMVMLN